MNIDVIKGTAIAGNITSLFMSGLIASSIYFHKANISHPLEGGLIVIGMLLGSPLIVLFQILATLMTRKSEFTGLIRYSIFALNILGVILAVLFVLILIFLILMGPINPG